MRFLFKLLLALVLLAGVALAGFRIAADQREVMAAADAAPEDGRLAPTALQGIFAIERGPADGPPVLLIHGSVGWSGSWRHTLEVLAQDGYRAIAIDLPPMGYSDRDPDGDYGRAASAARILAFIDAETITPHIVAHSFGAGAAIEAVMQRADAFASLTIINGALPLDPDATDLPAILRPLWLREALVSATVTNPLASRRLLQAFLYRKDTATDEVLEVLAQPSRLDGATEALSIWLPTLLVPPTNLPSVTSAAYGTLDLPVALIWGEQDTTTPLPQGENLRDLIPGASLTILPDVGHIPMIEDPAAFDAALLAALSEMR
ncbi:alpha/beta fold hydrolase [Jannaschia sp. CCS1]|uniref:alpha/beta fold hydrolase n=1 Tax=Jannaschia sp. (strain CCS1) TaxID=290400 RepID=UPI00006BFF7B|nr:alpha/beta hydrolase [Jannaschia sp. CCS1]ABD53337.1 alpha/beta hydrolase [Jannaschia sp. CCS1]